MPPAPGSTGRRLAWAVALVAAAVPLWVSRALPMVDLPQHLYILDVLARLHDPATLYSRFFEARPGWSPYVGYYDVLRLLHRFLPLEPANRVFLTACVVALPLSLAFLLRALGRPTWPAILAVTIAYGDSFGWGFLNFVAALPLTFLSLGAFVRALADPARRPGWALLLAASLCAVFACHPVPVALLALALPFLLATTRVPEDGSGAGLAHRLRPRLPALLAVVPLVVLALGWAASIASNPGVAGGRFVALLTFATPGVCVREFLPLLAGLMRDGSDRWGPVLAAGIGALAGLAWAFGSRERPAPASARRGDAPVAPRRFDVRPLGLVVLALALYFLLPIHVRAFIYRLNLRFAPYAAGLALGLVPPTGPRATRALTWLAVLAALATAGPLARGFRAFDREEQALEALVPATAPRPVIMGLVFDDASRVAINPVYLHSAAVLARRRGGIPNFTFAGEAQMPIRFRAALPPPLPSEWHPEMFDYATMGPAYDHFLVRGIEPGVVFGDRLRSELYVAGRSGDFWLVRRRR